MDGDWVWTAIGLVGGVFFVLNYVLDQVARAASRVSATVRAVRKAKAALGKQGRPE